MTERINIDLNEHLPMKVTVRVDDEIVHQGPAHSFLRCFMDSLYGFFSANVRAQAILVETNVSNGRYLEENTVQVTNVAIVAGKMRLTTSVGHGLATDEYAYVMNVNTITGGAYLGYQRVTFISSTVIELADTAGLSGTHSDAISVPYIRRAIQQTEHNDAYTFGRPQIRVGRGTTANAVTTTALDDPIVCLTSTSAKGTLQASTTNPTIATPTVGATNSVIEIEQAFVNNSGSSIDVNEVGIWTLASSPNTTQHFHHLIVRDVLGAPVTVNAAQTLTVTYELTTDVPATTGGVLIQFNELLYRQLAQTTREAKTIDNANSTLGQNAGQFRVSSCGGNGPTGTSGAEGETADRIGIQLGSSTTSVVNTNYALQDGVGTDKRFPHGNGTDQLYHSGTYVDAVNTSGSNVQFTCHKIFDNQSGSGITANDVGLYCAFFNVLTNNYYAVVSHCLARFQIPGGVTIPTGQLAKVEITLQITV